MKKLRTTNSANVSVRVVVEVKSDAFVSSARRLIRDAQTRVMIKKQIVRKNPIIDSSLERRRA